MLRAENTEGPQSYVIEVVFYFVRIVPGSVTNEMYEILKIMAHLVLGKSDLFTILCALKEDKFAYDSSFVIILQNAQIVLVTHRKLRDTDTKFSSELNKWRKLLGDNVNAHLRDVEHEVWSTSTTFSLLFRVFSSSPL